MNRFALLGKNIAHSKSPEIYRRLISPTIQYDLLDYQKVEDIPSLETLFRDYGGVNITSPYKEHFLKKVFLSEKASEVGAINCLKMVEGKFYGENTDYFAVLDGLNSLLENFEFSTIVILGDGVMSRVAKAALGELNRSAFQFSRKLTEGFNQLDLSQLSSEQNGRVLVINTCSRDFIFSGILPSDAIFWDFNYNFPSHMQQIPPKVHRYIDGYEMLERQAFYAVSFWSNRKFS